MDWHCEQRDRPQSYQLSGYTLSEALGVSGNMQVGYGYGTGTGNNIHAMLWTGTADSAMDLNAFLPTGYNTSSVADAINSNGDIVGYGTGTSGTNAFLWHLSAAPEPSPVAAFGIGALGLSGLIFKARKRKTTSPSAFALPSPS